MASNVDSALPVTPLRKAGDSVFHASNAWTSTTLAKSGSPLLALSGRSTITNGRDRACRPSAVQPDGVDSHRDEGARSSKEVPGVGLLPPPKVPDNWEISIPTHRPFPEGWPPPPLPLPSTGHEILNARRFAPQQRNQHDRRRSPGWYLGDLIGGDSGSVYQENATEMRSRERGNERCPE